LKTEESIHYQDNDDEQLYLRFYLDKDLYAVKLMDVQEVIEYIPPKKIPNTHPYFLGVINVRGEIVGVVDLRKKMNYQEGAQQRAVLILLKDEDHSVAAVVDQLLDVKKITTWDNSVLKNIDVRLDQEFVLGVHLDSSSFVIGIDLKRVFTHEDVLMIENSKIKQAI
jgi:purine-binding chemotaxis protein CheW